SFGVGRKLDRFARRIGACTGDDRNAAGRMIDGGPDQQAVFFEIHRRRFTGSPDDDDAVSALADVEIDESAQPLQVETAVLEHRRDDGDEASLQHGGPPSIESAILTDSLSDVTASTAHRLHKFS